MRKPYQLTSPQEFFPFKNKFETDNKHTISDSKYYFRKCFGYTYHSVETMQFLESQYLKLYLTHGGNKKTQVAKLFTIDS